MALKAFTEDDIELTLPDSTIKLDERPKSTPKGMQLADFHFTHGGRAFLIELKDPSHPKAARNIPSEVKKLQGDGLISEQLAPKARGSYCWLHLMKDDKEPITYIVLLGTSALPNERALLLGFKDRLLRRIRHEPGEPWKRAFIADCIVVSDTDWNRVFKTQGWTLKRLSAPKI